ncbi:hypothetical protein OB236_09610, partial [Paenibacillus sp. WQ 127069]
YYQFWINEGAGWQIAQAYSTSNVYSWTPTKEGNYRVIVWLKDWNSQTVDYDLWKEEGYSISGEPLLLNSVTFEKQSPQPANTTLRVTANASGGTGRYYQFWINEGAGWQIAQAYSTSNVYSWTPTKEGNYRVVVWLKDWNSQTVDYDLWKEEGYSISGGPLLLNSLTFEKQSPQPANTTLRVTANASGGTGRYYQFWINEGAGWQIAQAYSTSNVYSWTPTKEGNYRVVVWLKDWNSQTVDYDLWKEEGYTVVGNSYQYINLFVKSTTQAEKQINGQRARLYSDGRRFVNLQSSSNDISGLVNNVDYFADSQGYWFSEAYLSTDSLTMTVSSNSSGITLNVKDTNLIARAETPVYGGEYTIASTSACSPNCDYTIYLMAGIGTYRSGMWPDSEVTIDSLYGSNVQVYELFPYNSLDGFSGIKLIALRALQIRNVAIDSMEEGVSQRIQDEINFVKNNYDGGKRIIIGHSGGGVAGARTARYLQVNDPVKIDYLAMVGSPRTSLKDINTKVISIAAPTDPVPDTTYFYWPDGNPASSLQINLAPQSNGFATHATYFQNLVWNNGQNNNVTDTMSMIYSFAH